MKLLQHRYMPMALAGAAIAMLFVHLALGVLLLFVVGGILCISHYMRDEEMDETTQSHVKNWQLFCALFILLSGGAIIAREGWPEYSPELPAFLVLLTLPLLAVAVWRKIISKGEAVVYALFTPVIITLDVFIVRPAATSDLMKTIYLWLPRTFPEYTPLICLLIALCVLVYCVRAVRRDKMEFLDAVGTVMLTLLLLLLWLFESSDLVRELNQ